MKLISEVLLELDSRLKKLGAHDDSVKNWNDLLRIGVYAELKAWILEDRIDYDIPKRSE